VLVAALVGASVTARLGVWQLSRASQKIELQAAQDARASMPPLRVADLATARSDPRAADAQHYRRTVLRGHWLPRSTIYLENRQMNTRVGFFVVTPLLLEGRTDAVLVQRGWAPRDLLDRTRVPDVPTPAGRVEVEGRIAPAPGRLYEFAGAASRSIRQNLDPAGYGLELGVSLRPWSLLQDAPERLVVESGEPAAPAAVATIDPSASSASPSTVTMPAEPFSQVVEDGLLRQWSLPALDVQKHYGYAFQWFAMCALIAGLYVWFQLVRPRVRSRRLPDASA